MARQIMLARGFEPNFPPATQQQLLDIKAHPPQLTPSDKVRDLRGLLWSSIDNDTSKDLDQIEVAERLPNGDVKVMVGIADVDAFVAKDSHRSARGQGNDHRLYRHHKFSDVAGRALDRRIVFASRRGQASRGD
jgi:exoribonuclease R